MFGIPSLQPSVPFHIPTFTAVGLGGSRGVIGGSQVPFCPNNDIKSK